MPIGKNGNGLTLLERFIPDGLSHAATAFVESLKINSISEKLVRGRPSWSRGETFTASGPTI